MIYHLDCPSRSPIFIFRRRGDNASSKPKERTYPYGEKRQDRQLFVVAFNLVGVVDLALDYYRATQVGLPALAGQLGAGYAIPIIYVPMLMITHIVAIYWLLRPQPRMARVLAGHAVASD